MTTVIENRGSYSLNTRFR